MEFVHECLLLFCMWATVKQSTVLETASMLKKKKRCFQNQGVKCIHDLSCESSSHTGRPHSLQACQHEQAKCVKPCRSITTCVFIISAWVTAIEKETAKIPPKWLLQIKKRDFLCLFELGFSRFFFLWVYF